MRQLFFGDPIDPLGASYDLWMLPIRDVLLNLYLLEICSNAAWLINCPLQPVIRSTPDIDSTPCSGCWVPMLGVRENFTPIADFSGSLLGLACVVNCMLAVVLYAAKHPKKKLCNFTHI